MALFKVGKGATRNVLVFNSFVVKFPTFLSWSLFLRGLLANMQEALFSGVDDSLCPVLYANKFGFMLIMPKAAVIPCSVNWAGFSNYLHSRYDGAQMSEFILSDLKPSNWGILKGKLVKIDYGSDTLERSRRFYDELADDEGLRVLSEVLSSKAPEIKRIDIQKEIEKGDRLLRQYLGKKCPCEKGKLKGEVNET